MLDPLYIEITPIVIQRKTISYRTPFQKRFKVMLHKRPQASRCIIRTIIETVRFIILNTNHRLLAQVISDDIGLLDALAYFQMYSSHFQDYKMFGKVVQTYIANIRFTGTSSNFVEEVMFQLLFVCMSVCMSVCLFVCKVTFKNNLLEFDENQLVNMKILKQKRTHLILN